MAQNQRRDPYDGFGGDVGRTVAESSSWWPPERRPRRGAPNVVVVVADDMGYSDIGPFGSEIATPALDRLAEGGLRLSNYHTTPVCSPARAALMTGLNPHRAGYANVANVDPGFPGYRMEIADDVPTLPETLRSAGYATFAVGKWHLVLDSAMSPSGSRASWPCQRGFDRYYGVLEGLTNLHHPHQLFQDNSPIEVDRYPDGYYLTDDLTDQAIGMIKSLRAHDAEKPFFLYLAHPAVHAPLHAKPADIARYRGRYADGWDALREERFARQIAAGVFPDGTRMAPPNHERGMAVPRWDDLPADRRDTYARYMEVYAAMVDSIDQNLARLTATIEALGELDDTLVIFTSDNGGSGEGGDEGTNSYFKQFIHGLEHPPDWGDCTPCEPDQIGGPRSMVHYPQGWAMASNTPFRLYKSHTYAGGVRVPFVVSWPNGLARAPGDSGVRDQYAYVTDVLPTLLELTGVEQPAERAGQPTQPLDGTPLTPWLRDRSEPSRHTEQYSEFAGNRSFYRDGWKLVTLHERGTPYSDAEWRLYNIRRDPTETNDLAAELPEKVAALALAWEQAAWINGVFPLDDGSGYVGLARRPERRAAMCAPVRLLPGTPRLERYRSAQLIGFRSFEIAARVAVETHDKGVIVAHGDQGGGYALYVEDGRLAFAYNEYGRLLEVDCGPLEPGAHDIRVIADAVPDLRWDFTVLIDGVEHARLSGVQMLIGLAPFAGISVGSNPGSPVSWPVYERHGPFPFTGQIGEVGYDPCESAHYAPEMVVEALQEAARAYE